MIPCFVGEVDLPMRLYPVDGGAADLSYIHNEVSLRWFMNLDCASGGRFQLVWLFDPAHQPFVSKIRHMWGTPSYPDLPQIVFTIRGYSFPVLCLHREIRGIP